MSRIGNNKTTRKHRATIEVTVRVEPRGGGGGGGRETGIGRIGSELAQFVLAKFFRRCKCYCFSLFLSANDSDVMHTPRM